MWCGRRTCVRNDWHFQKKFLFWSSCRSNVTEGSMYALIEMLCEPEQQFFQVLQSNFRESRFQMHSWHVLGFCSWRAIDLQETCSVQKKNLRETLHFYDDYVLKENRYNRKIWRSLQSHNCNVSRKIVFWQSICCEEDEACQCSTEMHLKRLQSYDRHLLKSFL